MKDRKETLLSGQRERNEMKAARLRFQELLSEAGDEGLSATLHVSPDKLSPPARLLGKHYRVDGSRGLVSPLRSENWSEESLEARLREIFNAEGIEQDAAHLIFEADPAWLELTPDTLLQFLPHMLALQMDWALLERSGAWCCFVNRHGNLGFSRGSTRGVTK